MYLYKYGNTIRKHGKNLLKSYTYASYVAIILKNYSSFCVSSSSKNEHFTENVVFLEMCRLSSNHYLSHSGLTRMHNMS